MANLASRLPDETQSMGQMLVAWRGPRGLAIILPKSKLHVITVTGVADYCARIECELFQNRVER